MILNLIKLAVDVGGMYDLIRAQNKHLLVDAILFAAGP